MQMRRDDFKTVKRMNKEQLTAYLTSIFRRGYKVGLEEATGKKKTNEVLPPAVDDKGGTQ